MKYYNLITNCSKKNNLAIANMPYGEITSEYYFRYYSDGRTYWNDTRVMRLKIDSFANWMKLWKWLRENCSRIEWEPAERVAIEDRGKPYIRPIAFATQPEPSRHKLTRTYRQIIGRKSIISEKRHGNNLILLDNDDDVGSVLDGDLDLLNLSRDIQSF